MCPLAGWTLFGSVWVRICTPFTQVVIVGGSPTMRALISFHRPACQKSGQPAGVTGQGWVFSLRVMTSGRLPKVKLRTPRRFQMPSPRIPPMVPPAW